MKTTLIFIFSSIFLIAQQSFTIISVSPFFTYGKYSNQVSSQSKAIYGTLNFDGDLIFSSGVDFISLKGDQWDYDQNSFYFYTLKKFSSLSIKFSGVYLNGKYKDTISLTPNYRDDNVSLTTELIYDLNWKYLGIAYNYFSSTKGYQILKASNLTLRFDTFLDYYTYLSVRPNLYLENSGKKYISLSSKLIHWFSNDFVGNLNFMVGNRRYYFDNDLLTIYNQYEIQKLVVGGGVDYSFIDELTLSAGYQYTEFESFNIKYFFLGLRSKLIF